MRWAGAWGDGSWGPQEPDAEITGVPRRGTRRTNYLTCSPSSRDSGRAQLGTLTARHLPREEGAQRAKVNALPRARPRALSLACRFGNRVASVGRRLGGSGPHI